MRGLWIVILPLLAIFVVLGLAFSLKTPEAVETDKSDPENPTIEIPGDYSYGGGAFGRLLEITPDGKKIIFVAHENRKPRLLYMQAIGESKPVEIAGTDQASDPSVSPDGRYVVFYAGQTAPGNIGSVKKAALDGSGVSIVGKVPAPRGMAWLDADTLILGNTEGPLLQMSLSTGETSPLFPQTGPKQVGPQLLHLSPHILPGNKAILVTHKLANGPLREARLCLLILKTGEERLLLDENAFAARYVPTGHIVFARGVRRQLMAVAFDLKKLEIAGTPTRVLDTPVFGQGTGGSTDYAFSTDGTLVYTTGREPTVDDVLAELTGVDTTRVQLKLNWFDELKRLVP